MNLKQHLSAAASSCVFTALALAQPAGNRPTGPNDPAPVPPPAASSNTTLYVIVAVVVVAAIVVFALRSKKKE